MFVPILKSSNHHHSTKYKFEFDLVTDTYTSAFIHTQNVILLSAYSLRKKKESPGQVRRYLTLQIRAENFLYFLFSCFIPGRIVAALCFIAMYIQI